MTETQLYADLWAAKMEELRKGYDAHRNMVADVIRETLAETCARCHNPLWHHTGKDLKPAQCLCPYPHNGSFKAVK